LDLVISDYTLPVGDGAKLLAEFKEQTGCTTIMVSGHPRPVGALPVGVDEWVPKPVDLAALTRIVQSTLKRRRATVDRKTA
jgi:DNA-binding response OmpR family regulator